jgi:hypothetical protein
VPVLLGSRFCLGPIASAVSRAKFSGAVAVIILVRNGVIARQHKAGNDDG